MKGKKSLEEKIDEVDSNMPGMKEKLKTREQGCWGDYSVNETQDVEYIVTDNYKVVAAKKEYRSWSEGGGGVGWSNYAEIYYQKKDKDSIKVIELPVIKTRDRYKQHLDRKDLWPYDYISVKEIDTDRIEVSWVDHEGKKGPTYKRKLR